MKNLTKWIEAKPLKHTDPKLMAIFMYENISAWVWVPKDTN